jgi:hypothetical protein
LRQLKILTSSKKGMQDHKNWREREREREVSLRCTRWNQLPRRLWFISMSHDQLCYRFTSGDLTFQEILELEVRKLRPILEDICCLPTCFLRGCWYLTSNKTKVNLNRVHLCRTFLWGRHASWAKIYKQVLGHLTETLSQPHRCLHKVNRAWTLCGHSSLLDTYMCVVHGRAWSFECPHKKTTISKWDWTMCSNHGQTILGSIVNIIGKISIDGKRTSSQPTL